MLSFLLNCKRIYNDFIKDEVTVYAAPLGPITRPLRSRLLFLSFSPPHLLS